MSILTKSIVAFAGVGVVFATSQAVAAEVKGHAKVGYDTGGDTLVTVVFNNGDRENIKANQGFFFGGGVSIVTQDKAIETEISLTYKVDDITASNGDVTWSRWPLDALVFYRWDKVRVGGGLTDHFSPKLSGGGVVSGLNVSFKTSVGEILQADWRITEKMNLGARYTILDYELKNTNTKIKSNGLGIVFSGSF